MKKSSSFSVDPPMVYIPASGGRAVQRAAKQDDYMLFHKEADPSALAPLKTRDSSIPCRPLVEAPDGLRRLDWSGQGLTLLPPVPTIYENARVVNLQDNRLTDFPAELKNLHLMQALRIDCNSINSVPGYIASFSLLTDLRAAENSIETLSSCIGRCYHLTSCDLRNNRWTRMPSSTQTSTRDTFPRKCPSFLPCPSSSIRSTKKRLGSPPAAAAAAAAAAPQT